MSSHTTLQPGGSVVYSTRPVGLETTLFAQCSDKGDSTLGWHYELCCQPLHQAHLEAGQPYSTSLSSGAGALVTVSNQGYQPITVWTDY